MADPSYINSQSVNWPDFYSGILPPSSSAAQPTFQPGMLGRGQPASSGMDRLPSGSAGLPNPSPGSGLTPQQLAAMGGMTVDSRTGQLSYVPPTGQNPAAAAANGLAASVPLPRPRPPWAPTTIDMAAIAGAQPGANPGMGGAMIGNGVMSPAIPPQQPPPNGAPQTKWGDDIFGMGGGSGNVNGTVQRGLGTNGYIYGKNANGDWSQQGKTGWAEIGSPSDQYAVANAAAAQAAKIKQASLTGTGTNGYDYVNGVNVGRSAAMAGLTPSQQYALLSGLPMPGPETGGPSTGTNVSHTPVQQSVANPNGAYGATGKRDFTFFGPQGKPSGGSRF